MYNSFGISGRIIHAICTQGWGQGLQTEMELWRGRCNQADSLWEGKETVKKNPLTRRYLSLTAGQACFVPWGNPLGCHGVVFYVFHAAGGLVRESRAMTGLVRASLVLGVTESDAIRDWSSGSPLGWRGEVCQLGTGTTAETEKNFICTEYFGVFGSLIEKTQASCAFQVVASVGKELWHDGSVPKKPWVTLSCLLSLSL